MDLIHSLIFRDVEAEWQSMLASRTHAAKSEVTDLYWRVRNLEERMKGFSDDENRELAEKVAEYKRQIHEFTGHQPGIAALVVSVREQAGDHVLGAWVRDETGLHEVAHDPERREMPMPWLVFEIVDDRHVLMDWMFAPLAGRGTVRVVEGEGEAARLVEESMLWIS